VTSKCIVCHVEGVWAFVHRDGPVCAKCVKNAIDYWVEYGSPLPEYDVCECCGTPK